MKPGVVWWIALCAACLALATPPALAKRIALVMGNDNYQHVSKLYKAGNDAVAMGRELKAAGFEVLLHRDLTHAAMVRAIDTLTQRIEGGDEVVVFFAGHGVQIKSGNYLLPVDINATSEAVIDKTSYALNDLMEQLGQAKAAFSLVMVDACRDNPLKSQGRSLGATRGLSAPEPPKGQMVVYSASKGQQALDRLSDSDSHPNGVFTREFIARMKRPGIRVEELVREVQDAVEQLASTVSHVQRPALYNEARGNFYFFSPGQGGATAAAAAAPAAPGAVTTAAITTAAAAPAVPAAPRAPATAAPPGARKVLLIWNRDALPEPPVPGAPPPPPRSPRSGVDGASDPLLAPNVEAQIESSFVQALLAAGIPLSSLLPSQISKNLVEVGKTNLGTHFLEVARLRDEASPLKVGFRVTLKKVDGNDYLLSQYTLAIPKLAAPERKWKYITDDTGFRKVEVTEAVEVTPGSYGRAMADELSGRIRKAIE